MSEVDTQPEAAAPGRRRSDRAHQAILQATKAILAETGYRALTIEAIAARAGVGKKTIYRWWPSKAVLALEALTAHANAHVPFPDTGSLKEDLLSYFARAFPSMEGGASELLHGLVAETQLDAEFGREFQRIFVVPRRDALIALLRRGAQRGELAADADLEVLADMIYGAKWYRFLMQPAPLDEGFARAIVDLVVRLR